VASPDADDRAVDEVAFREAISHFATGVTVITTLHEGKPAGMTASAVASLSLDPVLLLVCVNTALPTHQAIESSRRFVVNVLGEGEEELALHFARRSPDKFAGIRLRPDYELPVLEDAIAHFVCDLEERFPGGDHAIFTGLVRECATVRGKRPLVYFQSGFVGISNREDADDFTSEALGWGVGSFGRGGRTRISGVEINVERR
jgi:flavin reductase (DIM6/NTAB) family NADH-FMN oxidoreductase RutF